MNGSKQRDKIECWTKKELQLLLIDKGSLIRNTRNNRIQ